MRNPYDYYITPKEYEIAAENGISRSTLNRRIRDLGWGKESAITTPVPMRDKYGWNKVKEIALQNGIARHAYCYRIKRGWTRIDAISQPPLNRSECMKRASELNSCFKNKALSEEQMEIATLNGISYTVARDRIRRLGWAMEEAITIPIMTRSECGKKGKGASFWSKIVIPSREEMMKHRKLTYIAN